MTQYTGGNGIATKNYNILPIVVNFNNHVCLYVLHVAGAVNLTMEVITKSL
jgi:hypothetical protein